MGFFGRASNLVRGALLQYTRPDTDGAAKERAAREAALEQELAGGTRPAAALGAPRPKPAAPSAVPPGGAAPNGTAPAGLERDEFGNVKRTL